MTNKGRLLILLTAVLWSCSGVCTKSITWSAMAVAAANGLFTMLCLMVRRRSIRIRFTKRNVLCGLIGTFTGILLINAYKLTTSGTAITLQYIAPILIFLFSVFFRHRKAHLYEWILTFSVFLGCGLSFLDSLDFTQTVGNLLALGSGMCYSVQIMLLSSDKCDSEDCLMLTGLFEFLICLPFAIAGEPLVFDANNIIWVLILGILQGGCANACFARGVKLISDVETSLLLSIEPICNIILAAIICNEILGFKAIAGAVLVIVCVTLYSIFSQKNEAAA